MTARDIDGRQFMRALKGAGIHFLSACVHEAASSSAYAATIRSSALTTPPETSGARNHRLKKSPYLAKSDLTDKGGRFIVYP